MARLQLRPPPPDAGRHSHTDKLTLRDTSQSRGAGCLGFIPPESVQRPVILITWSELCDFTSTSASPGVKAPVGEIVDFFLCLFSNPMNKTNRGRQEVDIM